MDTPFPLVFRYSSGHLVHFDWSVVPLGCPVPCGLPDAIMATSHLLAASNFLPTRRSFGRLELSTLLDPGLEGKRYR